MRSGRFAYAFLRCPQLLSSDDWSLVIGDALWAVAAAGPSDQNALPISTISHYFSGAALMALDDDFARNRQALTTDCQDRSGARAHTRARV
jgi:hypothetical protein